MVDSRAGRVLDEEKRAVLGAQDVRWLEEQLLSSRADCDHLLVGSSLPWLLPPLVHDAERWSAALCGGVRGARWARRGETLRQASDLEHWAAFPASFDWLTGLLAEAAAGGDAPATVAVLSGDVHHAYVAEPERLPATAAQVVQLTCSPMHQRIPYALRLGFRFGWSRAGRALGRALARHGRTGPSPVAWRRTGGPWFGNQLMTLTLRGREARLRLEQARGGGVLTSVHERALTSASAAAGPPGGADDEAAAASGTGTAADVAACGKAGRGRARRTPGSPYEDAPSGTPRRSVGDAATGPRGSAGRGAASRPAADPTEC